MVVASELAASAVLETRHLSKSFDGRRVLDSVTMSVLPGTVHALMGGNGSGKSTFIKCLSGFYVPDPKSEIFVNGVRRTAASPDQGLAFVHQDLGLIPDLNVMENLALGRPFERSILGRIDWAKQARATRDVLEQHGLDISPYAEVRGLSAAMKASVGIARALSAQSHISLLVLDEPTASLQEKERERLLELVRTIKAEGTSILYVSHRLHEVMEISDSVSVLRDGALIATTPTSELTELSLIELMMGGSVDETGPAQRPIDRSGTPRLSVRNLTGPLVDDVSLDVYPGEVHGVTGLLGAGHNEFGKLLFGATERESGTVQLDGATIRKDSPRASIRASLAYIPTDRQNASAIPTLSVRENMTMLMLGSFLAGFTLNRPAERRGVARWLDKYDVRPRNGELAISQLSGGNQQKAIVCKWIESKPAVVVVDEPTQGVDVRARAEIYQLLENAATDGAAVVLIDSDVDELVKRCDRVSVFFEGRLIGTLAGDQKSRENISELTNGLDIAS